jgi:hypothetical protein
MYTHVCLILPQLMIDYSKKNELRHYINLDKEIDENNN